MKDEAYNLLSKGELLPGFEQSAVILQLAKLFKVDESKARQILDKQSRVILKQAGWEQAIKYCRVLRDAGLVVYMHVVLDAEIFRESLVPVTLKNSEIQNNGIAQSVMHSGINNKVDIDTDYALQTLSVDISSLVPSMFAKAHTEALVDNEEKARYSLQSWNPWFNPKFLLLISMFVALVIQKYFGLLLVQATGSTLVTPFLILLFFIIILFLPKFMSLNRVFTLRSTDNDNTRLLCTQLLTISPFSESYHIYNRDNDILAKVKLNKLKNLLECWDNEGSLLYSSNEEHYVDDVTKDVAAEIRDQLFDFSVLTYLKILSQHLRKLKAWYNKENTEYKRNDAFVIRDNSKNKIAYFSREKISVLEFPFTSVNESNNDVLLVFLLICAGVS